jgi:hypothetical protein
MLRLSEAREEGMLRLAQELPPPLQPVALLQAHCRHFPAFELRKSPWRRGGARLKCVCIRPQALASHVLPSPASARQCVSCS